jgi:hypothetical protein
VKVNRKVVVASLTAIGFTALLITSNLTSVASAHDDKDKTNSSSHNHSDTPAKDAKPAKLKILGDTCDKSKLDDHNGFQSDKAKCVDTQFGEVSALNDNPTLLITDAPLSVGVGKDIVLQVSTRNLVRDRFLGAAAGGYYIESAFLNSDGLTRGHFHTGCRLIGDGTVAPPPFKLGKQFVATEDKKGSSEPDVVTVTIPGFTESGKVQCAAWAGDGSHRIPMMSFAAEIPAFDSVRIDVR